MNHPRLVLGILLLAAALIVIVAGYGSVPSAQACNTINSMNQQLGGPATCSASPAAGYFVAAGLLGATGLLMLAPWLLRWLASK